MKRLRRTLQVLLALILTLALVACNRPAQPVYEPVEYEYEEYEYEYEEYEEEPEPEPEPEPEEPEEDYPEDEYPEDEYPEEDENGEGAADGATGDTGTAGNAGTGTQTTTPPAGNTTTTTPPATNTTPPVTTPPATNTATPPVATPPVTTPPVVTTPPAQQTPTHTVPDTERERQELIRLINAERARVGSNQLTVCQELMDFAQIRASEGSRAGGAPHTRPDGSHVANELWTGAGGTNNATGQRAFDAFMNSTPHRESMLSVGARAHNNRMTFGVGICQRTGGAAVIFDSIIITPPGGTASGGAGGGSGTTGGGTGGGTTQQQQPAEPAASYSLSSTRLSLVSGESYQFEVFTSNPNVSFTVDWRGVNNHAVRFDNGRVEILFPTGGGAFSGEFNITARIYEGGRRVETLQATISFTS